VYIEIVRRRAFCLIVLWGMAVGCSDPPDYSARIAAEREAKDETFRQVGAPDSPIRPGELETFVPLSYFPIDESYAVPAELEPAADRVAITMPTSTGKLRNVQRIGTLKFNLKGQPLQLTAFLEEGSSRLFVPFSDLTGGTETYQAGRYMNLDPSPSGIYIVDFNIAYNPYCYYNAEYDCPLPPRENRLAVPIRAGERMRKADTTIDR
jgi:uncharacterized protein (DUF1684 family)